jgi:Tol biopolymer transport system component/DNA-binding winged helix-turn-helix (wHTH) protein
MSRQPAVSKDITDHMALDGGSIILKSVTTQAAMSDTRSSPLQFGVFEANLATGELRKNGRTVKLQPQPFKLLALFLERPGELVTREEIHQKLWGGDTFVDFEQGVNFAVKKLREALGDDSARPRYIETVPRRGYRFIAPLERARDASIPPVVSVAATKPQSRVISISDGLSLPHDALQPDTAFSVAMGEVALPDLEVAISPGPRSGPIPVGAEVPKRKTSVTGRLIAVAAILAVAAAVVVASLLFLRHPPQPSPELTETRLTFNSSARPVNECAVSPDGKYLAYSDRSGIHVRLISTGEERLMPRPARAPDGAYWAVDSWFPDGTHLLADAQGPGLQHSIWTLSVLGESASELRESAGAWDVSPDGKLVAFGPVEASGRIREVWVMGSQGENPRRVLAPGENESLDNFHWSPDGKRLAYTREPRDLGDWFQAAIETCDLTGAKRSVVVSYRRSWDDDFCWLRDGRIVYSREEPPGAYNGGLWQVEINGQTGAPTGKPKRITQWADSLVRVLNTTADGKQLALKKMALQQQVYLGEFAAGGTRMNPPRLLTNDEASASPTAWTPDGKAVLFWSDRNGTRGIFKQGINQETADLITAGSQGAWWPILSPDGEWILYSDYRGSSPARLMRIPASGGAPQVVLEMGTNLGYYRCARAPASLCVLLEDDKDKKQLAVTAFDPLKGRGKVLRTLEKDPLARVFGLALSPDGSTLALSRCREPEIHIRLLSLSGGSDREIVLKAWSNLAWGSLEWTPDGKGLLCASSQTQGGTILYVDLKGNSRALWEFRGAGGPVWGIPSPDGHFLAMRNQALSSNVWMLEGF